MLSDLKIVVTAHPPCIAVICVLHGYAYGLGIDLCVCADIRLCASTTKFAVKEIDLGLAADVGTLSRLPRCVGSSSWVKDVCLTARTFDADEAHRVGFVSGVFETKDGALEEGLRLAGVMSSKSPVAVQGTKELLNHSRDHSVQDSTSVVFLRCLSLLGPPQPHRPRFRLFQGTGPQNGFFSHHREYPDAGSYRAVSVDVFRPALHRPVEQRRLADP